MHLLSWSVFLSTLSLIILRLRQNFTLMQSKLVYLNFKNSLSLLRNMSYVLKNKTQFDVGFGAAPQLRAKPSNSLNSGKFLNEIPNISYSMICSKYGHLFTLNWLS